MKVYVLPYGLAVVDGRVTALCRMRKGHFCANCGLGIHKGDEAYRPLRNVRRWERYCQQCVKR